MEPAQTPLRPLAGTELSWLKAVPTGTGINVIALQVSRPLPPFAALIAALNNLQISHPILNTTLSQTHLLTTPSPLLLSSSPLPPRVPSTSILHSVLEFELNLNPWITPTTPTPRNYYATLYEGEKDGNETTTSAVLALRFHPAVCDRTSTRSLLKELLEMLGSPEGVGEARELGEVGRGVEELMRREDASKPFWVRGKDLLGYSVNGLRSAGLPFEVTGSERTSQVVRMVLEVADTERLLNACKAKGVKLGGALAAAGLIATYSSKHRDNNQHETYSIVTLIDCRKFLDPVLSDHDIGFYLSAILNTLSVDGREELWEVAVRCHSAYSNAKNNKKHLTDIGELNFLMCKAIENPHLTPSSSLRTGVISVFEEPVVYESNHLHQKLGVEDYIGCASVHGVGPSIGISETIRDGRLDCVFVYPSPLHSRKQVTDLVEHMKQILIEGSLDVHEAEENA